MDLKIIMLPERSQTKKNKNKNKNAKNYLLMALSCGFIMTTLNASSE